MAVNAYQGAKGEIRLACRECYRDDFDGTTLAAAQAAGWTDIGEEQTYEEACRTYDDPADAPPGYRALDWMTHLGLCPECAAEHAEPDLVVGG